MAQAGCVRVRPHRTGVWLSVTSLLILISLALAGTAAAELTGNYVNFAQCPYTNPEASKCIYSETVGGEVVLGSKKVPIVNPAVLQGAYTVPNESKFSKFIGATNGITLSKAPQPIPGGLAGIVPTEGSSPLVKAAIALFFENDLTGASATLELARPASDIRFSEFNFGGETGTALRLPIKIHLENPLLGPSCYVGSTSSPIAWNLTSDTASQPGSSRPIVGSAGKFEFLEEARVIEIEDIRLAGSTWAVPRASGCGGFLSFLINPIVNTAVGLPSAAGKNVAVLSNTAFIASARAVRENNAENP